MVIFMNDKKGFTLVELVAVISILGVLLLIAVPSISALQERIEKSQIKEDAEMFILLAKQKIKTDTGLTGSGADSSIKVCLNNIDASKLNGDDYTSDSCVNASQCGFYNDSGNEIFECMSYKIEKLENSKYIYRGDNNFSRK